LPRDHNGGVQQEGFGDELLATAASLGPATFQSLKAKVPLDWISKALEETGVTTVRRRRLPAEQVVWLVLGIALYRDRPIEEVVDKLDLALGDGSVVARSSIAQARTRVGEKPLKKLFEMTAAAWSKPSLQEEQWNGLTTLALDGTVLRVPDSEENRETFGGQTNPICESAYPLVRIVALMAARSHVLIGASVEAYDGSNEHDEAVGLLDRIPNFSVTIIDRNFQGANLLVPLTRDGIERHYVRRAKTNARWEVVEQTRPGDAIVELSTSSKALSRDKTLPKTWRARAIEYEVNGEKRTILTSLMDPKFKAKDIVALYGERWEIELAYGELKTDILGREETIRSRTPVGVEQEVWGLLLTYNLIRVEMQRIAAEAKVSPRRISFVFALLQIRDEFLWSAMSRSPGAIPRHLADLRARIKRFVLPERRTERSYPRTVKSTSGYPRKRTRRVPK
jgi:hypothetical protein